MYLSLVLALTSLLVPAAPAPGPLGPVKVAAVKVSSALPPWKGYTFDAANLIDGRLDTSWQPAKMDTMGVGQWVELDLGAMYELSLVEIAQGLQKFDPKLGDLFCRNNRFATAWMLFDDGTHTPIWAGADENPVKVELFYRGPALPNRDVKTTTRFIRLVVESVLDPVDWKDMAIAEIRVFGRLSAPAVTPTIIACDRPGAWPLRVAVSNFCAANVDTRSKRDCAALMRAFAECQAMPPLDMTEFAKGRLIQDLAINGTRHRIEFTRSADGTWSIKRQTRLDAAGKPAPPVSEWLTEPDPNERNKCWEKLGKKRPEYYDPGHDHEGEYAPE